MSRMFLGCGQSPGIGCRGNAVPVSRNAVNKPPETRDDLPKLGSASGLEGTRRAPPGATGTSAIVATGKRGLSRLSGVRGIRGAVLAALLSAVSALPALANERHAALIVDANNGAVIHAEAADEQRYPASLTKMMTLYMAFEAIERGRMTYATRLKVSHEAASAAPTKLDLDPGETIALIDAMKALITKSANDAAIVIAEHLGGSEANFARLMTAKARLIGMSRTTFRNASGLPDPGQVTTARDMIRLALRLQDDFPRHYPLFSTRAFSYDGSNYRNHNNLLYRFQGTDGIKTGYTRASGFNLVSSVRRGGRHVVGAVFGGRTASRRDDAMQLLLARALNKSSPYKTRQPAPVLVASAEPARRPTHAPTPPTWQAAAPAPASTATTAEIVPARPRPVMVPPRPRPQVVADASASLPRSTMADIPAPVPAMRPQTVSTAPVPIPAPDTEPIAAPFAPARPAAEPNHRLAFVPRGFEFGTANTSPQQDALAVARGAPPSTFQQQATNLTQPTPIAAPMPMYVRAGTTEQPGGARGAAPSTFQQQASSLSRGASVVPAAAPVAAPLPVPVAATAPLRPVPPPPYAVRGPVPAPTPAHQPTRVASAGSPAGSFEIQIGAYATQPEADRALSNARGQAGDLLRGGDSRALLARKDNRQIYRARFVGFDSARAASTCLELRRRQIDCFVMRAE